MITSLCHRWIWVAAKYESIAMCVEGNTWWILGNVFENLKKIPTTGDKGQQKGLCHKATFHPFLHLTAMGFGIIPTYSTKWGSKEYPIRISPHRSLKNIFPLNHVTKRQIYNYIIIKSEAHNAARKNQAH